MVSMHVVSSKFLAADEDSKWNCQQLDFRILGNWPIRPINIVPEIQIIPLK